MKKNYTDGFNPIVTYSTKESKNILSSNYIEIGRECYKYKGLKNKKNDILVYSAVLAGLNNKSEVFSYTNTFIANRLNMDVREVRRAIKNLEEQELVEVIHPGKNKRNIKILNDLRYPPKEAKKWKPKKSVIKVYDRIFFYPIITKSMVHIYSYYLALTSIPEYPGFSTVSYRKVAEALGYSEKHVINTLKEMKEIGLVGIGHLKSNKNIKAVSLEVDFSKKQPEEIAYEEQLERRTQAKDDWEWEQIRAEPIEDAANIPGEFESAEPKRVFTVEDDDLEW